MGRGTLPGGFAGGALVGVAAPFTETRGGGVRGVVAESAAGGSGVAVTGGGGGGGGELVGAAIDASGVGGLTEAALLAAT